MAKRRIAFVVPSLSKGGAERVVVNLANYMAEQLQLSVTIIIFYQLIDCYAPSDSVVIHNIDVPSRKGILNKAIVLFRRLKALRYYFNQMQFDTIFSFMDIANIPCALTGYLIVISVRENLDHVNYFHRCCYFLYKRKNILKIVSHTARMKNSFKSKSINNVRIIPNPIISFENNSISLEKEKILFRLEKPFILAVGRLEKQKNFPLLLKAFSMSKISRNYNLYIAGEGNEQKDLLKLINILNFNDRVKLLGLQNDQQLDWLYKNAHVFVMSSNHESWGNVLVEALSRGCPVVSTNCPYGPAEIITHGKNGLLLPVNDIQAITRALDLCITDHELYEKLSANAESSVQHLAIGKIAKQWLSI